MYKIIIDKMLISGYDVNLLKEPYKQPLRDLQEELEELLAKRADIDRRIMKLRQAIVSVARLMQSDEAGQALQDLSRKRIEGAFLGPKFRLVDALRWILKVAEKPLTPIDVKAELEKLGYDMDKPNLLSSIHITLDRLVKSGEAREVKEKDKKAFLWNKTQEATSRTERQRMKRKGK